jgi:fatty-acyl-CoA synthase
VLRDAFVRGDAWFRTGDLMRKDERGYFYFVDRIGDTFRWKGENVSTAEVAETIAAFPAVSDVVVYGVRVPGMEGRAGMAAIVIRPAHNFDLVVFREHLVAHLPAYARPLFLRTQNEIAITATFKPRKQDLMRDGFDPAVCADLIFYDDPISQAFVRVDAALYDRIHNQKERL